MKTVQDQADVIDVIRQSGFSRCEWERLTGINRKRLKRIEEGQAVVTVTEAQKILMVMSPSRRYVREIFASSELADQISEDKWECIEKWADTLPFFLCSLAKLDSPIQLLAPGQVINFVLRKIDEQSQELAKRQDRLWTS